MIIRSCVTIWRCFTATDRVETLASLSFALDLLRSVPVAGMVAAMAGWIMGWVTQMAGQFPVQHGFNHAFWQLVHQAMTASGAPLKSSSSSLSRDSCILVSLVIFPEVLRGDGVQLGLDSSSRIPKGCRHANRSSRIRS